MTVPTDKLPLDELLDKAQTLQGFDLYKQLMETLLQVLLEAERDQHVNASRYERSDSRQDTRSGYKPRTLQTPLGLLKLLKPQTRLGMRSQILEDYERVDQALLLAAREMYVHGVSTRKVVELLEKTVGTELSATTVSKANKSLDDAIQQLQQRSLGEFPILMLDARFDKVRRNGVICSTAFLVLVGIDRQGYRHILDFMPCEGETKFGWKSLLERAKERGLHGVRWMVSDDHAGLREALCETFVGAVWQRCQVHIMRNVLTQTPHKLKEEVGARLKDVYQAPDEKQAFQRLQLLAAWAEEQKVGLGDYMEEIVPQGFSVFCLPLTLRRRLKSTNMVERIQQELKRRTKVARIFPSMESYERLAGSILVSLEEKWEEQNRRYVDVQLLIETLDEVLAK